MVIETALLLTLAVNVTVRTWLWVSQGTTLNPGVAFVAIPLALFAYLWNISAHTSHQKTRDQADDSEVKPSKDLFRITRSHRILIKLLKQSGVSLSLLGLYFSWETYEHLAFMSLNHQQRSIYHLSLLAEGGGVILLWSAYTWNRVSEWGITLVHRLHFPISISIFGLAWEGVLRDLDEPLQRLSTDIAVLIIDISDALGLSNAQVSYWDSFTIYSSQFYLIINETCAGVNLLLSMALYALGFGWVMNVTLKRAWLLVVYIIPLAILFNGLRVAIIFMLGHAGDVELATGPWHEGSGYLCQLVLFMILALLNRAFDQAPMSKEHDLRE